MTQLVSLLQASSKALHSKAVHRYRDARDQAKDALKKDLMAKAREFVLTGIAVKTRDTLTAVYENADYRIRWHFLILDRGRELTSREAFKKAKSLTLEVQKSLENGDFQLEVVGNTANLIFPVYDGLRVVYPVSIKAKERAVA